MSDRSIVIGGILVRDLGGAIQWSSGLAVDDDGSPDAYAPAGIAHEDALGDAGHPGNWWGIATDNGKPNGNPIVQGPDDPMPGAYVSETALVDPNYKIGDPRRYVDAQKFNYISVPPELMHQFGVRKGDVGLASFMGNSCSVFVGDVGPRGKLGEASPQTCRMLGIPSDPRTGGATHGVEITLWPGSTRGWPRTQQDIDQQVQGLTSLGG